jgi:hypothetical protein
MKTLILTTVLIFCLAATNHGRPINTIYSVRDYPSTDNEESYVDDIPFNTWEIAVEVMMDGDKVKLAEDPYVDDIPFDTRKISNQALLKKMEESTDEANVNDIPFDTEKVIIEFTRSSPGSLDKNKIQRMESRTNDSNQDLIVIRCSSL